MKKFSRVIFWGALWGITEATVGYFLHLWSLPIGWLIWSPLAYGFIWGVYRQTGQPDTIFLTALVASLIKLVDLLMPIRIDYVINPAVSIIFEGLAAFVVFKVITMQSQKEPLGFYPIIGVSILWRVFYTIYIFFLPTELIKISPVNGTAPLIRFLLFESMVNALSIYGVFKFFPKRQSGVEDHYFNPHPVVSLGMLVVACFIQWRL